MDGMQIALLLVDAIRAERSDVWNHVVVDHILFGNASDLHCQTRRYMNQELRFSCSILVYSLVKIFNVRKYLYRM